MRQVMISLCLIVVLSFPVHAQTSYRDLTPVERYLVRALDFMKNGVYRVNFSQAEWDALYEDLLGQLDTSDSNDLTASYPLIEQAIDRFGDPYAQFLPPEEAANFLNDEPILPGFLLTPEDVVYYIYPDSPAELAGIHVGDVVHGYDADGDDLTVVYEVANGDRRTVTLTPEVIDLSLMYDNIVERRGVCTGYIESLPLTSAAITDLYIRAMWESIDSLQAEGDVCSWIVDLRRNVGGHFEPIFLALGPFFGERQIVDFVYPYTFSELFYEDGNLVQEELIELTAEAGLETPVIDDDVPIVVLTSEMTDGAGYAALAAFASRPNVYVIGVPNYNIPTLTIHTDMPDSATLVISVASVVPGKWGLFYDVMYVVPVIDEELGTSWDDFRESNDPLINAALSWLERSTLRR